MKLIDKASLIAKALQEHGEQLSPQEAGHVLNVLASARSLKLALERVNSKVETDSFIFAKVTPKRIEPQYTYGSQVPCDTVHELAVCQAKLENNEWVPDLDNMIFRAIFPERVLAEMIFDKNNYKGKQVTLVEFNGVSLPKYERQEQSYSNYVRRFTNKNDSILSEGKSLLALTEGMEASRLTKEVLEQISDITANIVTHARNKCEFDLEMALERIDINSYHLRSEIQSSVYSAISKRSLDVAIEYKDKPQTIPYYEAYFNLKTLSVEKESLLKLLLLAEQDDETKALIEHVESIGTGSIEKEARLNAKVNQGIIKIGNPCGAPSFFFGDTRDVGEYFNIELSMSSHRFDEFGDRDETVGASVCQFIMTRYQMMELIRTSIGEVWTKATMQRNLNLRVATPQLPEDGNSIKVDGMSITKDAEKLESLASVVHALVSEKKKNNKEHRAKLAQAIVAMINQLEIEIPSRTDSFDSALNALFAGYEKDVLKYLESTVEKNSHLLTLDQKSQVLKIIKMV